MKCNSMPPDIAPVVLGFNYETHNASALSQQLDNVYFGSRGAFHCVFGDICPEHAH